MRSFTARSVAQLEGVHPDLVKVVRAALQICECDFTVVEGLRTHERQQALYAQGRTAPGAVVTKTLLSKHLVQGDGFGHAVDLYHIAEGKLIGEDAGKIRAAMFVAAHQNNVPIRWGGDWDMDGKYNERGEDDNPHFELWGRAYVV